MFLQRNCPLQLAVLKNHPEVDHMIRTQNFEKITASLNLSGVKDVFFIRNEYKIMDIWSKDDLIIDQLMQNQGVYEDKIPDEVQEAYEKQYVREINRRSVDFHLR